MAYIELLLLLLCVPSLSVLIFHLLENFLLNNNTMKSEWRPFLTTTTSKYMCWTSIPSRHWWNRKALARGSGVKDFTGNEAAAAAATMDFICP